jgi:hypothetical protein
MVETSRRAQGLVFPEVLDAQVREVVRDRVDEGLEDGLFVVADDEDFLDLGDLCNSAEAVLDNGVTCNGEERLWKCKRGVDKLEVSNRSLPSADPWTEA